MIGVIRGLIALVLMGSFVGMLIVTWSSRLKPDYERMSRLALDDENEPREEDDGR
jgi:hypothetical protein